MLCLKCGNEIKDNEQICSKCGYNKNTISNTDNPFGIKNQGIYNPNAVNKEEAKEKLDHQQQFHQLVEIYIGPLYNNFKKGSFSWCAFFLGPVYFIYRKLYSVGITIFILEWLIQGFAKLVNMRLYIYAIILIIIQIFLGTTFKKFYYNESMERIGKLKQENQDKGYNQLAEIAKQIGGTNPLYTIIAIIPLILLTVTFLLIFFPYILEF